MRTYTFKSIAQRGTLLTTAAVLAAATLLPAQLAFADALNPLTDRSLTLSSSSPGWSYTDGSQNATYAPPNSGANGKKTGNTFSFKLSSSTAIKALTLQYCTSPAGTCTSPGNNVTKGPANDTVTTADLHVQAPSAAELDTTDFSTIVDTATGVVKAVPGYAGFNNGKPGAGYESGIGGAGAAVDGSFVVYWNNGGTWEESEGWAMAATSVASPSTPANNFITLTNASGSLAGGLGKEVKVVFFGTDDNYITNPGAGAFFVRMNTYNDDGTQDDSTLIDGGVTVANVMNQSIWIQTKVLETMEFSVGTVDPNTLSSTRPDISTTSEMDDAYGNVIGNPAKIHGTCDRILGNITPDMPTNVLKLGDPDMEDSLSTQNTFSTHSYWRLSSNASAGATVYYSGHTLTNTVGDEITPVDNGSGDKRPPVRGMEQFGLALDNTFSNAADTAGDLAVSYAQEADYENGNDLGKTGIHASVATDVNGNASYHAPTLYPLLPEPNYNEGTGAVDGTPGTQFAFSRTSDTLPVPIAKESTQVVDCVTGKMRYMANIAATTPAGIYTTKVNYIAAPQY